VASSSRSSAASATNARKGPSAGAGPLGPMVTVEKLAMSPVSGTPLMWRGLAPSILGRRGGGDRGGPTTVTGR
jgi:hypothetical protein